jgi:hypothetical protein
MLARIIRRGQGVSHEDRAFYPLLHRRILPEIGIATLELLERFGQEVE